MLPMSIFPTSNEPVKNLTGIEMAAMSGNDANQTAANRAAANRATMLKGELLESWACG